MLYENEKNFRYHEFYTDSENFVKDIARLLALGFENDAIFDEDSNIVKPNMPVVDENWKIVYPAVDRTLFPDVQDWNKLTPEEYKQITEWQLTQIKESLIIKTKTTPKKIDQKQASGLGFNSDIMKSSTEMYLEVYFAPYLCDSEKDDPLRQKLGELPVVTDKEGATKTTRNFHHAYFRIFDVINEEGTGPAENVVDPVTRSVIEWNSRSSEWSKLAWYNDFENIYKTGIINGSSRVCIQPGITSQTKIKIWANVNRDRLVLAAMGSPNVDFSENRYMIASAYIGSIESFDFSVNDTAGNFGIYTTSSTIPSISRTATKTETPQPFSENVIGFDKVGDKYLLGLSPKEIHNNDAVIRLTLPTPTDTVVSGVWKERYIDISSITAFIKFKPDAQGKHGTFHGSEGDQLFEFVFANPEIKIEKTELLSNRDNRKFIEIGIKQSDIIDQMRKLSGYPKKDIAKAVASFVPEILCSFKVYAETTGIDKGVIRDSKGNVTKVNYLQTYGKNTANGTTDFAMYHTFGKDYFQKHYFMFASTEEYMQKELYGKSVYTGEYFADRIKVVHGAEGPRGTLRAMITIDTSSLYPFDELIVNKDFEKYDDKPEELFVYLPVTSPHCPFANTANAMHGIGILKEIRYPVPITDEQKVDFALRELERKYADLYYVVKDFPLLDSSEYGASIEWTSNDHTHISIEQSTSVQAAPMQARTTKKK